MKPLIPRTILFNSSPSSHHFFTHHRNIIRVLRFSTNAPQHSSSPSQYSRRHDEESRNVRVSVWWDFENCNIPAGANVYKVAHCITGAIRESGIKGPVQITAFGDIFQLSRMNQEALSSTGINLTHIPHGGKNSADRSLLVDLMYWVSQNPPPAHIFLISGDRDFASTLHRLRMNNYNVLLASLDSAPGVLCSAASIMWRWNALAKGERVTGKHFNQPPDGPNNSWYGHYKLPLLDPYTVSEQSSAPRLEESSECGSDLKLGPVQIECSESGTEPKLRPIPNAVMQQIRHILSSFPKGLAMTDFRSELKRSNIHLDKDYYGHKKFSRFLLSMPHILKVKHEGDGRYLVRAIAPKVPQSEVPNREPILGSSTNSGIHELTPTAKLHGQSSLFTKTVDRIAEAESRPQEPDLVLTPGKVPKPTAGEEVSDVTAALPPVVPPPSSEEQSSSTEVGFLKKLWRKWFISKDDYPEKTQLALLKPQLDASETDKDIMEPKLTPITVPSEPCTSAVDDPIQRKQNDSISTQFGGKPGGDVGLFKRLINWCKFRGSPTASELMSESAKKNSYPEFFSKESFWNDMKLFLGSPKGVSIISKSRNRPQMAKGLQDEGPLVLRSLSEADMLELVELLISEKKWLQESSSQTSPFKLTWSAGPKSSGTRASNGLSSMILGEPSESGSLKQLKQLKHAEAQKNNSDRDRDKTLSNCYRLMADLLKEHPKGFNMGMFKKEFHNRYGYFLDTEALGYPKLASLLQNLPGVRIESNFVLPSDSAKESFPEKAVSSILEKSVSSVVENTTGGKKTEFDRKSSGTVKKDEDPESPWEELGPVEESGHNRTEITPNLSLKPKEETLAEDQFDYEYYLSDDDSSDEEEGSALTTSDRSGKSQVNEGDSSLLQILDSWYSSKEENGRKEDCPDNVGGLANHPKHESQPQVLQTVKVDMGDGRKQKSSRSYSFVSNDVGDSNDKLINGILGSLKKSGESRMNSLVKIARNE